MGRTTRVRRSSFNALIIGGGVAALEGALALKALAADRVEVEIVSAEQHFFYRPLAVAEPFGLGTVHRWELAQLAREMGVVHSVGTLTGVQRERRTAEFATGQEREYDGLLLALGARAEAVVPGALTFRGPADVEPFRRLIDEVRSAGSGRLLFVIPSGAVWPLPLYELALMTAAELEDKGAAVEVGIVTSEPSPLALFGARPSEVVNSLLAERGIAVSSSTYPAQFTNGRLLCVPETSMPADWVVAAPRLSGPAITGIPRQKNGFAPVDEFCRIQGLERVYAAGDMTTLPVKQGGMAAAQADVAATSIAALAGAEVQPHRFRPVLRALLLTGRRPLFMRIDLSGGMGNTATFGEEALWWPPGKIVGRHLSAFLASLGVYEATGAAVTNRNPRFG